MSRRKFSKAITIIILISGLLHASVSKAQLPEVKKQPWIPGAYALGGFIIAHSPFMEHLAVSHPAGFELNLQKQTTGTKNWHQLYKFPKVGIAFDYLNLNNPVLGKAFAATTYLNKTLRQGRKSELNYRLGLGLGYLTNNYDQEENHKNTAVSSGLNAALQMRFEYVYNISSHYSALLGLGLNHYSNGATGKPNSGINIPTLSLGLNYRTFSSFETIAQELPELDPAYFYTISTAGGVRQVSVNYPEKYWVQAVAFAAGKHMNRKSNLLAGVEGFFDASIKPQQQNDPDLVGKPFPDTKKAGAFLGHELLFGDLAFETQLGFYVYRPYKIATPYYERLGLKYHFTPKVFGAVDLKVHAFAADILEWRVGYRF
jgi:hypothetical protein